MRPSDTPFLRGASSSTQTLCTDAPVTSSLRDYSNVTKPSPIVLRSDPFSNTLQPILQGATLGVRLARPGAVRWSQQPRNRFSEKPQSFALIPQGSTCAQKVRSATCHIRMSPWSRPMSDIPLDGRTKDFGVVLHFQSISPKPPAPVTPTHIHASKHAAHL